MVVTENKEEMSILGLLFSDYDFISLFKMKSKSVNKEEYIKFLKETFKKIDNEYSLIDDEEKKIIAKNKINDIVSRLDLNSDEINLNNYSWYEQEDTKKLALKR
ncbi:unknown [Clostridium sp. CAG:433]|jgi:hypothetical protein|nr:MAG: hypothetical protein BHW07_01910 [Clostridium sp. CAG_433_25_7]CDD28856.1 unknown [Clostridium sp. CAG:433]